MGHAIGMAAGLPPGIILPYGGATAPTGFLFCDGASLERALYPNLFAVLGTAYGAADGTHFNVPDLRQRFPLGKAASGTGNALGATGGNIDHVHGDGTLQVTVPRDGWGSNGTNPDPDGRLLTGEGTADQAEEAANDVTVQVSGNTGAENPPFQVVNFIVKT